jgi:hypothetical protein
MTMCRLTVRMREGVWRDEVDSWTSLFVLAALSAETETFDELASAVRRYQPDHRLFEETRQPAGGDDVETDGAWCFIDLAGRTVVAGNGFDAPDPRGAYQPDKDERADGFPIVWLVTPADWLFREAGDDWPAVVAARASARAAASRVDARAVLFGPPLLGHVAAGVLATNPGGAVDAKSQQELTRTIHAQWLMTPRADLGGRTPRELLLAEQNRLALDMEHRSQQLSMQKQAPPPLARDSAAYRFGGFGTIEVVCYFDLVRALFVEAWELTRLDRRLSEQLLIQRLAGFRDRWLDEPDEESSLSMTRAELIESERRRMPVTSDGSHLDCDCPICQAEADGAFGGGPAFLCFDGHHLELEDEFAFSMCETREEWERQQEDYRKFSEEMDRKAAERGASGEDAGDPLAGSAWQSSFVNWEALAGADASPQQALWAIAFPLAELVSDLRSRSDGAEFFNSLNEAYANLRTSQDPVARDSAAEQFRESLERVSGNFPELISKCADLQSRLDEILRRLP